MVENEEQREKIEIRLTQVASTSSEGTEKLGRVVRAAYRQGCVTLTKIADSARLNRFVETYIGPIVGAARRG